MEITRIAQDYSLDRGSTFNSQFLRALYKKLKIESRFSTAYHPETNGLAERTNQWVEGFLRTFCNYRQDDWSKWLPMAEFSHNNHKNPSTGRSAFEAVYGKNLRWSSLNHQVSDNDRVPAAEEMRSRMETIWDEIKASMRLHQGIEREIQGFKEGDKDRKSVV